MSKDELQEVGVVTNYYSNIGVAIIKVTAPITIEDKILIKGTTTDFEQIVKSMEIEHKKVDKAISKDIIGLKVEKRTRENDVVYKIVNS